MGSQSELQAEGGEIAPIQVHPAHVFWAMPRRIRLNFSQPQAGSCDLCGRASDSLIDQYITRNYGLNYKGPWLHPLSPYYAVKDQLLAIHPQPGGVGYVGIGSGGYSVCRMMGAKYAVRRWFSAS